MLRRSRFNPIRGAGGAFEEAITSTEQQGCVDRVCMVVVQVCIEIKAREEVRAHKHAKLTICEKKLKMLFAFSLTSKVVRATAQLTSIRHVTSRLDVRP